MAGERIPADVIANKTKPSDFGVCFHCPPQRILRKQCSKSVLVKNEVQCEKQCGGNELSHTPIHKAIKGSSFECWFDHSNLQNIFLLLKKCRV